MSVFKRTDTSTSWSSATGWTLVSGSGTYPISASDQAIWDSTVTLQRNISAVAVTIGQIAFQNPAANQGITAGTGTITLSPASFSNVGIDMSSGTTTATNLSIAAPLALGSSQSWSVPSNRALTVSGVISGSAKNLTVSGSGTTTLSANNSTGWTGSTLTVSGGVVVASDNRAVGAASNQIVVSAGGAIRFTGTGAVPPPTSFTVAGSGATGLQWGSIFFSDIGAFGSGKTITLTGASPVIGVQAGAQAGAIAGSPTGDVTFNMFGTNTTNATFSSPLSNFTVANGNRIVLQGVNPTTGATTVADFALATTDDYGLGNGNNKVSVKSSVRLITNAATTLYRDYFFEGQVGSGTPSGTTTFSIATPENALFRGTITATAGNWVAVNNAAQSAQRTLQLGSSLGGKLDGTWNLRSFSSPQTIYLDPGLDISTWTGALYAYRVSYGVAPTGAATYESGATIDNIGLSTPTLAHSGYTLLGNLTFTGTSSMSLGSGNVATSTTPTITVSANTLTIPGNISGPTTLAKNGAGTLILSGSNTITTSVTLAAGPLVLNSAGSVGGTGTQFVFTAAAGAELDSTTGVSLNQTGAINTGALAGSWTWKGTNSLTFGSGNVTTGGDRTITFANTGETGTLKFSGAITTATSTLNWNFGGATAGAKQRMILGGANASQAAGTAADQHAVTSGYFRIENANGLGAVGVAYTTTWWVGATNAGVQTVGAKAALELAGVTTPDTKGVKLYNTGPNDDGALIGASGTSVFSGNIEVPNVAGTRIGVKSGATLTLLGSGSYQNLNPANANTPLSFTAESGGTLNQNRILGANVGTVTVANSLGTVVFSRANLHTGAMTCSSGTTKLTDANAAGAGAGNSVTVSPDATMEVTAKVVFPATLTLGSTGSAATFKVSV